MWKLVFSLLVVVGILELVSPARMTESVVNQDEANGGRSGGKSAKDPQDNPSGDPNAENGKPTKPGNGAQNLWLSGGHAVAALLLPVLCLH
ncbi:hypothetical protein SprV_0602092300 [Sparganum proliferum]